VELRLHAVDELHLRRLRGSVKVALSANMEPAAGSSKTLFLARVNFVKNAISMTS